MVAPPKDLKLCVSLMQIALADHPLFEHLEPDQQVFALLQIASCIARVDKDKFLTRNKKARIKWADMVVKAVVPDLGMPESKI